MGETTGIAWTDATFNPWIGCTKVGPGCENCYAENANQRFAGGANWGPGAPRRRTVEHNWKQPIKWNRLRAGKVPAFMNGKPVPLWVFCASQADVFDNEVPDEWRTDLWALIRATPHLRWQLVTKRIGNVAKMRPADWGSPDGSVYDYAYQPGWAYRHVGIIATMVNQEEWDRDAGKLMKLKDIGVRWVGASVEPQIGPINAGPYLGLMDWVICGGESIQRGKARPFGLGWARYLRDQCAAAGVPFFMKQIGSRPLLAAAELNGGDWPLHDRAGADPEEWPEDLRVRQMPRIYEEEST